MPRKNRKTSYRWNGRRLVSVVKKSAVSKSARLAKVKSRSCASAGIQRRDCDTAGWCCDPESCERGRALNQRMAAIGGGK
jgi:hypothetical protein